MDSSDGEALNHDNDTSEHLFLKYNHLYFVYFLDMGVLQTVILQVRTSTIDSGKWFCFYFMGNCILSVKPCGRRTLR